MTLVIAHRGASAYAPENTLAAFALAARQGADMCELDVQCTADGVLAVFHDETTERWDGRARRFTELTWAEAQALKIDGEPVPTLAAVCGWAREQRMRLNIELKGFGLARPVADLVRAERVADLVLISSFVQQEVVDTAVVAPYLERAFLMGSQTLRPDVRFHESWPVLALRAAQATAWHPAYQIPLLEQVLPIVQRAGYRVNVWTVNDVVWMRRLIACGADGIITDTPDVLRGVVSGPAV